MNNIKIASVAVLFFSAACINADLIDAEINQMIKSHEENMKAYQSEVASHPGTAHKFGNYIKSIELAGCQNLINDYSHHELNDALTTKTQTALCHVCRPYWSKYRNKKGIALCAKK